MKTSSIKKSLPASLCLPPAGEKPSQREVYNPSLAKRGKGRFSDVIQAVYGQTPISLIWYNQ
jgi:hypothetical protein